MLTPSDLISKEEILALEAEIDTAIRNAHRDNKDGVLVIFTETLPSYCIAAWYALKPQYAKHWSIVDESGTALKPRIKFTRPERKETMIGNTFYPDDK